MEHAAYALYQAGRYSESADLFQVLVYRKPDRPGNWMGLASSRQMNGEFEAALKAWAALVLLDPDSPLPHFHAGECYLVLNNKGEAKKALQMAMDCVVEEHPIMNQARLLYDAC